MRKMFQLIRLILASPMLLVVPGGSGGRDANKAVSNRFWTDMWNRHSTGIYSELIAANFTRHDPTSPDASTFESYRQLVEAALSAWPDVQGTVEAIVADGDLVMTRFTMSGTHQRELMGIPANDKQWRVTGHATDRFEDGKIVERWENWDSLGLLTQLGAIPGS